MKKILVLIFLFIFGFSTINLLSAQDSYWVFFTDKKDVVFDPYAYFDQKAIDRRIKNGVLINDPSDWPLNKNYVNSVRSLVDSITGNTRWFNAIAVLANKEQIKQIRNLDFVKHIESMEYYSVLASKKGCNRTYEYYNQRRRQLDILGRKDFEKGGFNGKGIRIAIFDGGFPGVNTSPAFEQIRNDNRLIDTWDFTKNKAFVFYSISHGTEVMSNIGGMMIRGDDTAQFGLATEAEFLLAKTEIKREPYSEEKNWLMAVEWADKNGADIINSSLGYTKDRYFRSDMDGKTSLVTRAGNMAARKGILVVNAIGNDGDSKWLLMGAPADADSVLTVGGIDPSNDCHISFSSYGPTADGRMKPNVCAFGSTIVVNPEGNETNVQGTSFASPLIAGFAACALQANHNMKTMDLFHLIEKSGHLFPYYDYAHGYGVPQAKYIITKKKEAVKKTFEAKFNGKRANDFLMIEIINFGSLDIGESSHMYIKYVKVDGTIGSYQVVQVSQRKFAMRVYDAIHDDDLIKVVIFYNGYIQEINL